MSPNFQIAYRFLTAKKRAMLMSLACIILGVGMFVVTQATTSGFEDYFIRTMIGADGAIRIQDEIQDTIRSMEAAGGGSGSSFQVAEREGRKYIEGIPQPKLVMDALKNFSNVSAVAEVLHGDVVARSSFKSDSGQIYGIILDDFLRVSNLRSQIIQPADGSLEKYISTPSSALIGAVLAQRLQLSVGDSFQIEVVGNSQVQGQLRRYTVGGIFQTGVADIDRVRIYLKLSEARSLLQKHTESSYIQVSLVDKDRAPANALQMESALKYSAAPWEERQKVWLEVFRALSYSTAITVSIFTLIAGLAMFNTLAMMVMEKTKEIAILRSMGYTRRDISAIFIWQAVIVLVIGIALGSLLGAATTYGVSKVPLHIHTIFATDTFIVSWNKWHYVEAAVISIIMVMVASLAPARRAARLEPGDVIRGTAQ